MKLPAPYPLLGKLITHDAPTVFVVGANRGGFVDVYRNIWTRPVFHLFEVRLPEIAHARAMYGKDARVFVNRLAVAERDGHIPFHFNRAGATSSLQPWNVESVDYRPGRFDTVDVVDVPCTTLDNYTARVRVDHIDLLKMDIQGGEMRALEGAVGVLSAGAVDVVQCEVMFSDMYQDSPTFCELDGFLRTLGYKFYTFVIPATDAHGRLKWIHAIWTN